jgi:hypothetical protein
MWFSVTCVPSNVTYILLNSPPRPNAIAGPNIELPIMIPEMITL